MGKRWIVAFVNTIPSHYTLIHSHIQSCFRSSTFFLPTPDTRIVSRDPCIAQYLFSLSPFVSFFSSLRPSTSLEYYITWFLYCVAHYTRTHKTTAHPFQHNVCDAYAWAEWLKHHWLQCIVRASWADSLSLRLLWIIIIVIIYSAIRNLFALSLSLRSSVLLFLSLWCALLLIHTNIHLNTTSANAH